VCCKHLYVYIIFLLGELSLYCQYVLIRWWVIGSSIIVFLFGDLYEDCHVEAETRRRHFCNVAPCTLPHFLYNPTQALEHQTRTGKYGLLQIKCFTFHILDIMNIVEIILRNCCITDDIHMRPHTG